MTVLRHPHIEPVLEVDVADDRVAAHLAAGWLPVAAESATPPEADEPPAETPNRPRRRRAGSDSPKETAE